MAHVRRMFDGSDNGVRVADDFVRRILNQLADLGALDDTAIMLGTIVTLAHALGFSIIAEGVENTSQIQILSGLDCDTIQGLFFTRPAPAAEVPGMAHRVYATSFESRRRKRLVP